MTMKAQAKRKCLYEADKMEQNVKQFMKYVCIVKDQVSFFVFNTLV